MGTYQGARTIDGVKVLADGLPLDPRTDLKRFTDRGFEWTYEGVEPAQLALAWLLAVDDLVIPIPGTTKSKHLAENFAAGGITVDDHTLVSNYLTVELSSPFQPEVYAVLFLNLLELDVLLQILS